MLTRDQLDDIQNTYNPPEDSKLGIALQRAYEHLDRLEAVRQVTGENEGRRRRADGFLSAVRNHQVPVTTDNLAESVRKALEDQQVATVLRATAETQLQTATSNYNNAATTVNGIAVALRGAKSPGKVAHVRQKYLNEKPPAGLLDRAKRRVRAAAV